MSMKRRITAKEMADFIKESQRLVFLTGAGVSVPSGIPDYRSVTGLYTKSGLKAPEYLLSRRALLRDTVDFHRFIAQLYQKEARPNVIHEAMAHLEKEKQVTVITQNIDGLHTVAGSKNVVEFHGTLADCYCETCGQTVAVDTFLKAPTHETCGGLVRPAVVLYDEGIDQTCVNQAYDALVAADTVVIVGTSFQVYPFASLIEFAKNDAKILTINKTHVDVARTQAFYVGDATDVFSLL